ncbi:lipoprotein [Asanoa sp. WMMD1127]|uniref:lipoprotein n=1 Tax=Asanoa sp. WMMD1127 TaxID=3016107 RepID=UPI0024179812|nr:lipoprotein [Asanoa sp. WMMD1127]MDG4823861.1 lipoprotein [Asanoa sp. WMMD1127]
MRITPLATLVASVFLLGACGAGSAADPTVADPAASASTASPATTDAVAADATFTDPAPAAAGGRIGPGTACAIPATLSTAAAWTPKDASGVGFTEDGVTLRCEIDAKPAGVLGFIRVYTYEDGEARRALDTLLAIPGFGGTATAERQVTIGGETGVEAALAAEETGPGRVFAAGGVVLVWRGLDEEEFASGLPAYVLARTSITF